MAVLTNAIGLGAANWEYCELATTQQTAPYWLSDQYLSTAAIAMDSQANLNAAQESYLLRLRNTTQSSCIGATRKGPNYLHSTQKWPKGKNGIGDFLIGLFTSTRLGGIPNAANRVRAEENVQAIAESRLKDMALAQVLLFMASGQLT